MKAPRFVLLAITLMVVAASCGDDGPSLPSQSKDCLVQFKRVTLASETPDRLEIEIVVLTGLDYSKPARDGTKISIETTIGEFEGSGPAIEATTIGGHALVTLVLPRGPSLMAVTARVENVEAHLSIIVDENGSMRLGSS